jgi:uncharacterized protein YndB with AHSA1/START domain
MKNSEPNAQAAGTKVMKVEYRKLINIKATPEMVFKALTAPKDILHWYGAVAQLALRTGGHFTYADFDGDVYESGKFLQITTNELIKYEMEHHGFYKGSEVIITLNDLKDGDIPSTIFELTHTNLGISDLQHVSASWDWALVNLKNYLEHGTTQTFKVWFESNKQNYEI